MYLLMHASVFIAPDEVNRQEKIWEFIEKNKQLKDVHVPVMRNILPMLLMEAYCDHYARYVRKGNLLFFSNCM